MEFNEFGEAVEFLFVCFVGVFKGSGSEVIQFVVHVVIHIIGEDSHHAVDKVPDFLSFECCDFSEVLAGGEGVGRGCALNGVSG